MKVAVLGASDNPERYAYLAVKKLQENGHEVFPVNPKLETLEDLKVYPSLVEIPGAVDTITVYLSPAVSGTLEKEILAKNPRRLIFNPGAENPELRAKAAKQGIETMEACTLVMLNTGQF